MGKRLLLAGTVLAALVGFLAAPQLPVRAAGPVAFEHVFSDGDPLPKSIYTIPDLVDPCGGNEFVFRRDAYVLLFSASVAVAGQAAEAPDVSGHNLDWNLVDSVQYTVGGSNAVFAVYEAWADDPATGPLEDQMTFRFSAQQERHTRTFVQSGPGHPVDPVDPIAQIVWTSGTGDTATASLDAFVDPTDDAALFSVVKHHLDTFEPGAGLTELADTAPGPGNCIDGTDPHRLGTAGRSGETRSVSMSWDSATTWRGVALEIRAAKASPPTTSTTTTPPSSTTTVVVHQNRFVDDDDSVFEADIEAIAAAGVTQGCNPPANDRFCPNDTLTRGQMAAFMARALELTGDPTDRFIDDDDSVFEDDIELIAEAEITLGCNPPSNDRFCPDNTLTRGQMAAFMARALGLTGDPPDRFIDDDGSIFEDEIELIARAGITLGCNPPINDRFCPANTLTRGEMAAFLNRMLQQSG